MTRQEFRSSVLAAYGANSSEIEELLIYNESVFDRNKLRLPFRFPLEPEPHVKTWEEYAFIAKEIGVFEVLKQRFVQLQFPIREGISQTEVYRSATLKGILPNDQKSVATGLVLQHPEQLQLLVHQSLGGSIPVLIAGNRRDFICLVQALAHRNEPKSIPDSIGACAIAGFNNWDRIRQYRQQWQTEHPMACSDDWQAAFRQLAPHKELYQDRFIILSSGPYSAVSATELGLSESEWLRLSLNIRLEHECAHYFTLRLLGSMRNNLLDELIADYRGIVASIGRYRADWFLRFLGLTGSSLECTEGGRLHSYRGQPPLSDGAFKVLWVLVQAAAENLEQFDTEHVEELSSPDTQALILVALAALTLEELASEKAAASIQAAMYEFARQKSFF
jgi:hypothetical protein